MRCPRSLHSVSCSVRTPAPRRRPASVVTRPERPSSSTKDCDMTQPVSPVSNTQSTGRDERRRLPLMRSSSPSTRQEMCSTPSP
eukprot:7208931-Prymnesium_polylepis.1